MHKLHLGSICVGLLLSLCSSRCEAQVIRDWGGGGSTDRYDNIVNWIGLNRPDSTLESARFNLAGSYDVTLETSGLAVSDLIVNQGAIGFSSFDTGVTKQYNIDDDLIVTGPASFTAGKIGASVPVTIDVDDELRIDGGGSVVIQGDDGALSQITSGDLRLADIGTGSGSLTVLGKGARYEQTSFGIVNIGQDGPAQLTVSSGATVDFNAVFQLVSFADANSTANVLVEDGGQASFGTIQIATGGTNAGVSGDITVTGTNSQATLSGSLSIAGNSMPLGSVNVLNRGFVEVGTNTAVNPSGSLTVDDLSTFRSTDVILVAAGGSVLIDNDATIEANGGFDATAGGGLQINDGFLTVRNGAFLPVDPSDSSYTLEGDATGNARVTLGAGATTDLPTNFLIGDTETGSFSVTEGANITPGSIFRVGESVGGNGGITVRNLGSTLQAGSTFIGNEGSGVLNISDEGTMTAVDLRVAYETGSSGFATVTGVGSSLTTSFNGFSQGDLTIGREGNGELRVLDGAVVDAGDLRMASALGGESTVFVDASQLILSGSVFAGGGGPADLTIDNGGSVEVDDDTVLFPEATITIRDAGSSYQTRAFDPRGGEFVFDSGSLTVEDSDQDLVVSFGAMSIGGQPIDTNSVLTTTIQFDQNLNIGGDVIVTPGAEFSVNPSGTLSANRLLLLTGSEANFFGGSNVTINGKVQTAIGSVLNVFEDMTLGDPSAVDGVVVAGEMVVSNFDSATLLDANDVVFDSGAAVRVSAGGEVIAANGLTLDFGGNITGSGTVNTPDDPTKPLINNGNIAGDSVGSPITLTGYVKGVGTCDFCMISGTDAPGFSPASVLRGTVAYRGKLELEVGGASPGSEHDRLEHLLGAGVADLGGELEVQLINGFTPSSGDTFELITASGSVTNVFDTETLPALGGGLAFDLQYDLNAVSLVVAGIEGDYNFDGLVDAADYTVWRDSLGSIGTGLAADGDLDGDIDQDDYAVWVANFGQSASVAVAIPEPSCAVLALGLFAMGLGRSKRR